MRSSLSSLSAMRRAYDVNQKFDNLATSGAGQIPAKRVGASRCDARTAQRAVPACGNEEFCPAPHHLVN